VATFARESRTLRAVAGVAHFPASAMPLVDGDRMLMLGRAVVTGNLFDVLGARPVVGRLLRAEDDAPGAPHVMVISHAVWRARFGGDPGVVGRRLVEPYTRTAYTIVGVAPPGLDYPTGVGFWMPMWVGGVVQVYAVGRLAPGATRDAAAAELLAAVKRLSPQLEVRGARGEPFAEAVVGSVRPALVALGAAVGLLLLIACVNVGTLLLVRAAARSRELAVRRALGARPRDVVRQLAVESLVLGAAGGALGLACAEGLRRLLVALAPTQLPRVDLVGLAGAPLGLALAVTLLAVLACGVLPALGGLRVAPAATMRHDARSGRGSRGARLARQWLVASQVALAVVLLAGAGLVARSLARLEGEELGFVAEHLTVMDVSWDSTRDTTYAGRIRWGKAVLERARALPGVVAASPMLVPPFVGANYWRGRFEAETQGAAERAANPFVPMESADAQYFRTFGIPIVRGRALLPSDDGRAPRVAVVSESVARRFWGAADPIGKRIRTPPAPDDTTDAGWRTVVGVVRDTRFRSLRETTPMVYVPWEQLDGWQGEFAVRATGDPAALAATLRRVVREVAPDLDAYHIETMAEALGEPLARPRMTTLLLSGFSVVALLLAAVGLYGALASVVGERTRELGVRMALGAAPRQLRRAVLGGTLAVVGAGGAAGVLGALAGSRLLASLLYEVSPTDPATLLGVCALLVAVGLAAAYVPARRATRISPVEALRAE
jgi:putative ABC transport system permease protein